MRHPSPDPTAPREAIPADMCMNERLRSIKPCKYSKARMVRDRSYFVIPYTRYESSCPGRVNVSVYYVQYVSPLDRDRYRISIQLHTPLDVLFSRPPRIRWSTGQNRPCRMCVINTQLSCVSDESITAYRGRKQRWVVVSCINLYRPAIRRISGEELKTVRLPVPLMRGVSWKYSELNRNKSPGSARSSIGLSKTYGGIVSRWKRAPTP